MPGADSWLGSKNSNCRAFEECKFFCCRVDENIGCITDIFDSLFSYNITQFCPYCYRGEEKKTTTGS